VKTDVKTDGISFVTPLQALTNTFFQTLLPFQILKVWQQL